MKTLSKLTKLALLASILSIVGCSTPVAVSCPPTPTPPSQLMEKPITYYLLPKNAPLRQSN